MNCYYSGLFDLFRRVKLSLSACTLVVPFVVLLHYFPGFQNEQKKSGL
jgi:hypothetical protein